MSGFTERRGAHRPAGLGPTSAIPWLVAAVAIVAIVTVVTGWWRSPTPPGSSTVAAGASSTTTTGKAAPTTKGATAAPPTSGTTSGAQPAQADRTLAITVLNSTSTSGLAAKGAAKLKSAGWSIRSTGNYRGGAVSATTVFYGRASLKATADAVAADLGAGSASESADFGATRVTAVLAGDFRP